jgi:uncharacterized protein YjbI with pentapeptide repeats
MNSGNMVAYATLITALVAVVGVIVTVWKQLAQQEADRRRQLDERFTSIVANLGSNSPAIQASAAVSIISFLKPEYKAFHGQVFMVLLANLKLEHDDVINRLLITGFQKVIRIQSQSAKDKDTLFELDLSRSNLCHADLSGLDLRQADLGFAKLQGANLANTNLRRVRGWESNMERARLSRADLEEARLRKAIFRGGQFHNARLVSADLRETDLTGAQFYQAKMQSAHLEDANLDGAKFEQADLNDTFFCGAKNLNTKTLKSISKAFNWQKAHFDDAVRVELEKLAQSNSR